MAKCGRVESWMRWRGAVCRLLQRPATLPHIRAMLFYGKAWVGYPRRVGVQCIRIGALGIEC